MAIRVALNHQTTYKYDGRVGIYPQVVRLRPAPHCRTKIESYSLKVSPENHFLNWQQDPQGNFLARLVFPGKSGHLTVSVDLVADMTTINPFDFFLEPDAEQFPFAYEPSLATELRPFLSTEPAGPKLQEFLDSVDMTRRRTVLFLVDLNRQLQWHIEYLIRMEPGVQTPEETLTKRSGSCRDSAWLMVQALRHMGLAARFVSGYLIQLVADIKSLDGPSGPEKDFTDLHAWAEVYLPGAGWIGLDPTSGLFAGEGHIPLACSPEPSSAAPISGAVEPCHTTFDVRMAVTRVLEEPRVTKPYTEEQWQQIDALGNRIDADLEAGAVRLTMGGEPTFVSIDDMDGAEWNTAALGDKKRLLAGELLDRLRVRFAPGGLLHFGQGKQYPGEQLPRWAFSCYWRKDGVPIWNDPDLVADESLSYGQTSETAHGFMTALATRLGVSSDLAIPAYEDAWYYLCKERRLPVNVDPLKSNLADEMERKRLAKVFERGLAHVVGYALPLARDEDSTAIVWKSGPWFLRQEHMFLIPGDSPIGWRLPLDSLPWVAPEDHDYLHPIDPFAPRGPLPITPSNGHYGNGHAGGTQPYRSFSRYSGGSQILQQPARAHALAMAAHGETGGGFGLETLEYPELTSAPLTVPELGQSARGLVRTALCVEAREGRLYVFMPPLRRIEDYLALVKAVEQTADALATPVLIEGYLPPHDHRLSHVKVTPDPGVIEVNIHPAQSWNELVSNTTGLYEDARQSRLGTEKFMLDGKHSGTGGGNHVVMGGPSPSASPFLRRPDLLRSLIAYWNNHPSLSYLFSGMFVGPTSQAPRVDEARHDALHELEIAFEQLPDSHECPPWIVDRLFRNLLTDMTGNTHRAEFCIDKLFSPDSSTGRLGLVEFRAFEMPPHARMSLAQQLLLRALVAKFWRQPYGHKLVRWGTSLHDRYMLPHFVERDFGDVIEDLQTAGYPFAKEWFDPHMEFRFPLCGRVVYRDVQIELRSAIEPWHVLGEEPGGGGTVRYVDSSLERLQVKVSGMTGTRHLLACNRELVPLHPTGVQGEFVAGVRYRAWQPPNCLHPTIPVHAPLVFDLVDTWNQRSFGGCTWFVSHPGGRSFDTFPVNSNEAESRRAARFWPHGHTPGTIAPLLESSHPDFPYTLDLRRL